MKIWRLILIGFALALACYIVVPVSAQEPEPVCDPGEYYRETGHRVCDEFFVAFNAYGGLPVLGYPLTGQIIEEGRRVQYFQRGRLDYLPELSPDTPVQRAPMGEFLAPEDRQAPIAASERPKSNDPDRRYFPETGHTVAYSFLRYFLENGGAAVFGQPVTEFFNQDGRIVQYFEYTLLEWVPNRQAIVLHDIGDMWYRQYSQAPERDFALRRPESDVEVSEVDATASVSKAFMHSGEEQTVWVYVYDQNDAPVLGAAVTLVAPILPGGSLGMPPTDDQGHTEMVFNVNGLTPGDLVVIDALVEYNGLTTRTGAFFFAWW